jgi:phage tail-like protein
MSDTSAPHEPPIPVYGGPHRSGGAPVRGAASARHGIEGLGVKHPIGTTLPALFQDDPFIQRWCEGLDDVLAPVPMTLDNLWAYLDPDLCPEDFVDFLASWLGILPDQNWSVERRRTLVRNATGVGTFLGTASALADLIELYTGSRPDITEGGGVAWSETPDGELPGVQNNRFLVTLEVDDPSTVDVARLDRMVAENKPAHLAHLVEVVQRGGGASQPEPPPPPPADSADEGSEGEG